MGGGGGNFQSINDEHVNTPSTECHPFSGRNEKKKTGVDAKGNRQDKIFAVLN